MLAPAAPDVAAGIQAGLAGMRALHLRGYGSDGATAATANLAFPIATVVNELAGSSKPCTAVDVRDPGRFLVPPAAGPAPRLPRFWTILEERHAGELSRVAERIVEEGAEAALPSVPLGHFGKLLTVDRREIEGLRAIRAVTLEYWRRGGSKPLSIAVFGAPGSGKSFGVTQVAGSLLPGKIEPRQFNLSQFTGPAELHAAFHQVRDAGLAGRCRSSSGTSSTRHWAASDSDG